MHVLQRPVEITTQSRQKIYQVLRSAELLKSGNSDRRCQKLGRDLIPR